MKRFINYLLSSFFLATLVVGQVTTPEPKEVTPTLISVQDVRARMDSDSVLIVDVRTPQEFTGPLGHIDGAVLIPLQELKQRLPELEQYRQEEIIVVCRSGRRSGKAAILMEKKGFKALSMDGGMLKWNSEK
ncbi:MAG: rhodanese-like domain-containing protein [Fidelibacterota bacterium]